MKSVGEREVISKKKFELVRMEMEVENKKNRKYKKLNEMKIL